MMKKMIMVGLIGLSGIISGCIGSTNVEVGSKNCSVGYKPMTYIPPVPVKTYIIKEDPTRIIINHHNQGTVITNVGVVSNAPMVNNVVVNKNEFYCRDCHGYHCHGYHCHGYYSPTHVYRNKNSVQFINVENGSVTNIVNQ